MVEQLEAGAQMQNPKLRSPLTLAFLGDAVYELCARYFLVSQGDCPVGRLNRRKVEMVKAAAQSAAFEAIAPLLTEDELSIYKRGRNASSPSAPKHAELADYRRATGVEALFGYLYLKGETDRIEELFIRIQAEGSIGNGEA